MTDLETFVDEMTLEQVLAYAKRHGLKGYITDPSQWPDDDWPDIEDELRVKVAEHMIAQLLPAGGRGE